jgi:RimJ/RimL family protein N-acetyltransferase
MDRPKSRPVAIIRADHIASRRVAEKIGMHEEKTAILDGYPAVIYTIQCPSLRAPSGR